MDRRAKISFSLVAIALIIILLASNIGLGPISSTLIGILKPDNQSTPNQTSQPRKAYVRPAKASPPYTNKTDMIAQWKALFDAHSDVCNYEVVGKSILGNDIYLFKVGNPSGGKVMFDGETHGNEDGGTELEYRFVQWLLESGDPQARHILQYNYDLFIPIINVDSNVRQNMRRQYILSNGTIISTPHGVDLNRNAVAGWGGDKYSSPDVEAYDYEGLYPGSEPETQAWRTVVAKYRPEIYLNCHIGATGHPLWYDKYDNSNLVQKIVADMDSNYRQDGFNGTYYNVKSGLPGGEIAHDAAASFGASGWVIEFCSWSELEPTLNQWLTIWWPRAQPLFIAFNEAVEVLP